LPASAGLQVRFGTKHGQALTPEKAHSLERLFVGPDNDRLGAHPQFQVVDPNRPADTESAGRRTVATRILIQSIISILELQQGL
jgi:hypothetical protein